MKTSHTVVLLIISNIEKSGTETQVEICYTSLFSGF